MDTRNTMDRVVKVSREHKLPQPDSTSPVIPQVQTSIHKYVGFLFKTSISTGHMET